MSTLQSGQRLGAYEVVAPLAAGGMGEVYRARDTRLERPVAIKVLPASIAGSAEARARFEREARAVAALSHPNILAIYDFGHSPEATYAVMELLDGETLRARLSAAPLPPRKAVQVAVQIARGLAAAHDRQIVHRDLKPENVFITTDGIVKILDFGPRGRLPFRPASRRSIRRRSLRQPNPALSWEPLATWRRSRCEENRRTIAPISSHSDACCSRCSPDAGRSAAIPLPRR
jgi:serine/threonine protein kinase